MVLFTNSHPLRHNIVAVSGDGLLESIVFNVVGSVAKKARTSSAGAIEKWVEFMRVLAETADAPVYTCEHTNWYESELYTYKFQSINRQL